MELQSEKRSKITPAMIAARKEIHGAAKNSNGNWGKYASAEALIDCCMNPMLNHGVLLTQGTVMIDGKNWVVTQATHESGEFLRSYTEIVIEKAMDSKKALSGQTYARRGGLEALLCIPRVDDDGEHKVIKPAVPEPVTAKRGVAESVTTVDDIPYHPVPVAEVAIAVAEEVIAEEKAEPVLTLLQRKALAKQADKFGVTATMATTCIKSHGYTSSKDIPQKRLGFFKSEFQRLGQEKGEPTHV